MFKRICFSKFLFFLPVFLQAQAQPEPVFPMEDYQASLTKMFFMVVLLIAFLIFTVWLLKKLLNARMKTSAQGKAIQILEKRPISPKSILYLIEIDGERFLISESQAQIQKIEKLKINIQSSE